MKRILAVSLLLAFSGCAPPAARHSVNVFFVAEGYVALRVVSDARGADVVVDGLRAGVTPFDGPIRTGPHEISIRASDGRTASWSGDVTTPLALRLDIDKTEEPVELGSMDPAVIDKTIKRSLAAIQACYERELPKRPHIHGKIVVNFAFVGSGLVEYARIKSSTMNDQPVEACVTREFLEIRYYADPERGRITVNYPLLFKTH